VRLLIFLTLSLKLSSVYACTADLDALVVPTDAAAYGIPAAKLDHAFVKVSVLTRAMFCDQVTSKGAPVDLSTAAFRLDRDFDADGKPDSAFVGTYENATGGRGVFLVVVRQLGKPKQKILFFAKQENTDAAVSYLTLQGDILSWWTCFACKVSEDFRFGKNGFDRIESYDDYGQLSAYLWRRETASLPPSR